MYGREIFEVFRTRRRRMGFWRGYKGLKFGFVGYDREFGKLLEYFN